MHRLQAYMTSAEWGSQALAGLAGTAAWWHGTDPAWWMQTMNTWPEPFPWDMALQAAAWYDGASRVELARAPTPEQPRPGGVDWLCGFRCGLKHIGNPEKQHECMVQECGASLRQAVEAPLKNLVAMVIGVGLVLIGSWALVK